MTSVVKLFLLKWLADGVVTRAALVAARDMAEVEALGYADHDEVVNLGTTGSGGMERKCIMDAANPVVHEWGMRDRASLQAETDEQTKEMLARQLEYERTHPPQYPRNSWPA